MHRRLLSSVAGQPRPMSAIPGPRAWPLVGTAPDFIMQGGMETRYKQDVNHYFKYGPIYQTNLGEHMVVICDPRDWYNVFRKEGKTPKAGANKIWPLFQYVEVKNVKHLTLLSEGQTWKENRKISQIGFFKHEDARKFLKNIAPVSEDFSRLAPRFKDSLDVLLSVTTFEMMASICFNRRMNSMEDPQGPNGEFARKVCSAFEQCGMLITSPNPLHRKMLSKEWKAFEKNFDAVFDCISSVILDIADVLSKAREGNEEMYDQVSESLMGELMKNPAVTKEWCVWHVANLMIAGVDTTAHIIQWLLVNLAMNQEVQDKLYLEFNEYLQGRSLTQEDVEKHPFSYLKSCVKESSRLTPAAGQTNRMLEHDIVIQGYEIPANTWFMYSPCGIQRDPKYFDNPDIFDPERWSKESVESRKRDHPEISEVVDHPMIPMDFSFGPRMCLGARVAQNEIMSLTSRLIQDYKMEIADPTWKLDVKTCLFSAPNPFPKLKFTPRRQLEN